MLLGADRTCYNYYVYSSFDHTPGKNVSGIAMYKKDKNYIEAKDHINSAIDLLKNGEFDQAEDYVKKAIDDIGTQFTVLKVVGEINTQDSEKVYAALESLGLILLKHNAYLAAMQSFSMSKIIFKEKVGKKSFKEVMDNHERYLSETSLFTDFALGMNNWMANNFETAETYFKKVILQLDAENAFIKYVENVLNLVSADRCFMGLPTIDDPSRFYELLASIKYWELRNAADVLYKMKSPISHSIPEVTDVIAGRGLCTATYTHFLRTIFDLLRQLEDTPIDNALVKRIKTAFNKIKDKNEVTKIGESFAFACIEALLVYKKLGSIPKHRYARLINLLHPLWPTYVKWTKNLLLKKTRVSFCEKNILQLCNQIDPLVFLVYEEGLSPQSQEKKAEYARMWTKETDLDGTKINKKEFEALVNNKADYQIFIVDRGEADRNSIGEVYFGKKPEITHRSGASTKVKAITDIKPTAYKILCQALKNKGAAGDIFAILEKCFGKDTKAHFPGQKSWVELYKTEPTIFWDSTSTYRKAIGELSKCLQNNICVKFQTRKNRIYKLIPTPSYCLLRVK